MLIAYAGTGGRHTDWWALGVLAHEMITGRSPWSSLTDKKLIKRQIRSLCIVPPRGVSAKAGQFICQLLTQDHRERLGSRNSNDVKHDPFFGTVDWAATAAGTAPAALIPPSFAFIEEDCERALTGYAALAETAQLKPSNWSLGVDATPAAPAVTAEPFKIEDPPLPTAAPHPSSSSSSGGGTRSASISINAPPAPPSGSTSGGTSTSTNRGRTPQSLHGGSRSKTPKAHPPKRSPRNNGPPTWK